jgi:myo-inositol catabolism protein IolC
MTSTQDKPKSFMQELDAWTGQHVVGPLVHFLPEESFEPEVEEEIEQTIQRVRKAIREKVLESYHNGQKRASTAVRQRR